MPNVGNGILTKVQRPHRGPSLMALWQAPDHMQSVCCPHFEASAPGVAAGCSTERGHMRPPWKQGCAPLLWEGLCVRNARDQTREMSRPNSFVRSQSVNTRQRLRKLIWLYVSNDFHTRPAYQPVSGPMIGTSNTALSEPTYAALPCEWRQAKDGRGVRIRLGGQGSRPRGQAKAGGGQGRPGQRRSGQDQVGWPRGQARPE